MYEFCLYGIRIRRFRDDLKENTPIGVVSVFFHKTIRLN